MIQISPNFTLQEFIQSAMAIRKGIINTPTPLQVDRIRALVWAVLQPARTVMGPIFISSGYRSPALNKRVNGAVDSQHQEGEAADLWHWNMALLFEWIMKNCEFDQLIWEYGDEEQPDWIHVSYTQRWTNRKEVLVSYIDSTTKKTKYKIYQP